MRLVAPVLRVWDLLDSSVLTVCVKAWRSSPGLCVKLVPWSGSGYATDTAPESGGVFDAADRLVSQ